MNLNIYKGRLTRDPEVRYGQDDETKVVARFILAVPRDFKRNGETETDFIPAVAFGKNAEIVEKYLHKGSHILTRGRMQNNNYEREDGQRVYGLQFVAEHIEFLDKKPETGVPDVSCDENGFMNIPDGIEDEVPFS